MSMGEHTEVTVKSGASLEEQDKIAFASHTNLLQSYEMVYTMTW